MLDYGIGEFLGSMFFMPVLIYFTFAIFDGIGIFKDVFKLKDGEEAENIFHHHFHYKDPKTR
jgi:hypothetical protein